MFEKRGRNPNEISEKPVKLGQELEVFIEKKGSNKQDGVANYGETNFRIIVYNAKENKEYKIKIVNIIKNCAFADIVGCSK